MALNSLSAECLSKSRRHLHSTDTPFCDALDIDGSASVNMTAAVMELDEGDDDDEDVAAPERKGNRELTTAEGSDTLVLATRVRCSLQNHLAYKSSRFLCTQRKI